MGGRIACLAAATAMLLSGCLYDAPLSGPSTNIDTRLLGVFEHEQEIRKKGSDQILDVRTHRVAVIPIDCDHYAIYYRDYGRKPVKTLEFTGWISRVDSNYYLTLRNANESSPGYGKYAFFKYDWRWPGNFVITAPELSGAEHATSRGLRKTVRAKLRDDTLFPFEGTSWKKLARINWDWRAKTPPPTEIPPSFDTGEDVYSPPEPGRAARSDKKKKQP